MQQEQCSEMVLRYNKMRLRRNPLQNGQKYDDRVLYDRANLTVRLCWHVDTLAQPAFILTTYV